MIFCYWLTFIEKWYLQNILKKKFLEYFLWKFKKKFIWNLCLTMLITYLRKVWESAPWCLDKKVNVDKAKFNWLYSCLNISSQKKQICRSIIPMATNSELWQKVWNFFFSLSKYVSSLTIHRRAIDLLPFKVSSAMKHFFEKEKIIFRLSAKAQSSLPSWVRLKGSNGMV